MNKNNNSGLKHTPGPWEVKENIDGVHSGKINLVYSQNGFICECSRQHRPFNIKDGGEANARLIAAAPEMMELLIKLLSNPTKNQSEIDELIYDAHCRGRELVEKATGLKIEEVLNEN